MPRYIPEWEYGICNGRTARRHLQEKNVEFVLWKKGDQSYDGIGHTEDQWYDMDPTWWPGFIPYVEDEKIVVIMKDIFGEKRYNAATLEYTESVLDIPPSQLLQLAFQKEAVSPSELRYLLEGGAAGAKES
jgi:hypothetical protein